MAFFAKPRLAAGATDFLLLPSSSFKVTPGQEQLQVDVGVNETLCVTSRDHDFYQCHTSGGSGYVSVEGFVPATFPCTFMINDKLPAAAKIRARTAPNNIADTIVYLVPGAIFTVLSTEGDWLRILSHEFSGTVGYVLQKSGTNVLLAMPTPPKVFVVLDTSVDVAIFDAPGFDGRVIASVPAYALMGTVDPRRKNWALLNPTQFDDADLAEQLYTQQLWVAISDGAADYLHEVPPYELLLNRVTRRLPSDSPIRLRHYPDPDAPEKGQVITNEVFTTLLKRTGGWAFVAVEGLTGWVHDSILRILGDNEDATPLDSSLNGNDLDDTRTEYTSVSKYDRNHYVPDYEDDEAAAPIAQMPSSRGAGQTQVNFIEPQRSKSDYPKGPSNTNANDDTRSVKTTATRLISLLKKTPSKADIITPNSADPIPVDSQTVRSEESNTGEIPKDPSHFYDFRDLAKSTSFEATKSAEAGGAEAVELSQIIKLVSSFKSSERLVGLRSLMSNLELENAGQLAPSAAPSVFYKDRHLLKSLEEPLCECLLDMSSDVQITALQCFLRFHATSVHCKGQMACKVLAAIISKLFISKNKHILVDSVLCAKYLVQNEASTFDVLLEGLNSKYYSVINHCLEVLHTYLSAPDKVISDEDVAHTTVSLLKYLQNFRLEGAKANIIRVCNLILGRYKAVALPLLTEFVRNPASKPEAVEQVQMLLGSVVLQVEDEKAATIQASVSQAQAAAVDSPLVVPTPEPQRSPSESNVNAPLVHDVLSADGVLSDNGQGEEEPTVIVAIASPENVLSDNHSPTVLSDVDRGKETPEQRKARLRQGVAAKREEREKTREKEKELLKQLSGIGSGAGTLTPDKRGSEQQQPPVVEQPQGAESAESPSIEELAPSASPAFAIKPPIDATAITHNEPAETKSHHHHRRRVSKESLLLDTLVVQRFEWTKADADLLRSIPTSSGDNFIFYIRGKDSIEEIFPQWNLTEGIDKADLLRFRKHHY